ncbi:MAG: hypothetical protein NTZ43_09375 [Gemmatimonadetes bacterium]|nr:hypothetical protein [Gemmatimonadota bacterium]
MGRSLLRSLLFALTLHGAVLTPLAAQSQPKGVGPSAAAASGRRPRLLGVFDAATGLPIDSVEVIDLITEFRTRTDANGGVALNWITRWKATDSAVVAVRKIGYAEQRFVMLASDTVDISVALERVTDLTTVVTTAEKSTMASRWLEPFETRRKTGIGRFVTSADLVDGDRSGLGLRDLLARRGIILCGAGSGHRGRNGGRLITYVDGVQQALRDTTAGTVSSMYAAFEFHSAATVPAQFNATGPFVCGYLLAWTRR